MNTNKDFGLWPWTLESHDVILHVATKPAVFGFLGIPRYSAPNIILLIDTMLNRHCACAISRDVYSICKMWAHISISHPHFAYSLCHFHWAPMKKNGCSLSGPKAKSFENFISPTICKFWPLGAMEIRGYEKSRFLLQKHHPCVNPRRLSHFAWRSVRGSAPPGVSRKKLRKSREAPIGMMCRR